MHTNYEIVDEHADKTTITLPKWDADVLQRALPNVHEWVQDKYNRVHEKYPDLSRRKKGDLVRLIAAREAGKHPEIQKQIFAVLLQRRTDSGINWVERKSLTS